MIYLLAMPTASEEPRVKKLLVQHIETVHHSEAVEDVLHSLLVILLSFSFVRFLGSFLLYWLSTQIWHLAFSMA